MNSLKLKAVCMSPVAYVDIRICAHSDEAEKPGPRCYDGPCAFAIFVPQIQI